MATKSALNPAGPKYPRQLIRVITRFDQELLERVDSAAAGMGLNRTAFIVNAVAERLLQLQRGSTTS